MFKPAIMLADTVVTPFSALLHQAPAGPKAKPTSADRHRMAEDISRQHAHQEGYATGYAEGVELGRVAGFDAAEALATKSHEAALAQFMLDLGHVEKLVRQGMDVWFQQAETEVEKLVSSIAREVLKQELQLSRSSVVAIVHAALREVTLSQNARIRVNPLDVASLAESKKEIIAACASLRTIEIVDDPSILGGCIVETDGGLVDASVEGQIDRLEAA